MRPELPYWVHGPFPGPQPFPHSKAAIRAPSPDLVAHDLTTESLRRAGVPPPKPRQAPAGATYVPHTDAVTASLNDTQIAGARAPQELSDTGPVTHAFFSVVSVFVALQGEHSDGGSVPMVVVEHHRTSECACCEHTVGAHAQGADDAFDAHAGTAASRGRGVQPADRTLSISLDIECADTAVTSSEELVGILGREEQRVRRYEGFCVR